MFQRKWKSDLVLVLLCSAPLVIHLQDDFLQLLLGASHQFGGSLPLPEEKHVISRSAEKNCFESAP